MERSTRHVDLFLSPSRFSIEMHRQRGFERPMRHFPQFSPDPQGAVNRTIDEPYFLVVARLERLKGIQTLIEVFRAYRRARLVIVGDGTYATELKRLAAGMPNVTFLGSVPFTRLRSLYANAVAVVAPSIGYETFGMTTIEGFANHTPAIVRDLGALPEPVLDSGGGIVFRTTSELIDALDALQSDRALRDDLGRRGYEGWLTHWSTAPHVARYLELVDEACSLQDNSRAGFR
jgi:glycosyltransferase involved in cell wall biosynthesis